MSTLSSLSDDELVARLPALVQAERHAMADVIEHLVEVERRRLYLTHAASSLYRYCIDRLGYSEDAALKRHRVAVLALRLPQVLEELRAGTTHLSALFLLSTHLTADNANALLGEARGKSRRELERLLARWFPRPDVAPSIGPVAETTQVPLQQPILFGSGAQSIGVQVPGRSLTCPGTGNSAVRARLESLSLTRIRVEFTARAEVYDKVERARQLLSHALPSGDLGELFERALDALLEKETRQRFGAGRPRKRRPLKEGSRHSPIEVQRAVWERDCGQCTFVDREGRRCRERHFLTLEHRLPFALGGPPTIDNVCLLCMAHNQANARNVFGEEQIDASIRARVGATRAELGEVSDQEPSGAVSQPVGACPTSPPAIAPRAA